MKVARLLICAGGTGGGVYPALSMLQKMNRTETEVLWVGGKGEMESDLIKRAGIPFKTISSGGLHGVGLKMISSAFKILKGTFEARQIVKTFKPDVILYTGGFVAAPMTLVSQHIPSVLFVPDIEPGMGINWIARYARKIAVTSEESAKYYNKPEKVVYTGYPIREEFDQWTKEKGKKHFNLHNEKPVLLVFGGSKGARNINRAIKNVLPELLEKMQIIHISGQFNWDEAKEYPAALPDDLKKDYQIMPYLHEMGAAMAAADLVVSRAGASVIGEFPYFSLPAILVPYPYAWRYQKVNADYLVNQNAALMIPDEEMDTRLLDTILAIMSDDEKRSALQANMKKLHIQDAAQKLADMLVELTIDTEKGEPG